MSFPQSRIRFQLTIFSGLCPKGDDPLTPFTDYRTIILTTTASYGSLGGFFTLTFNGESVSFPAFASLWSVADCEKSLQSLRNVGTVKCTRSSVNSHGGAAYGVQFLTFPVNPFENNVFTNDGNPSNSAFSCSTHGITGAIAPLCTITDVAINTLPGLTKFQK